MYKPHGSLSRSSEDLAALDREIASLQQLDESAPLAANSTTQPRAGIGMAAVDEQDGLLASTAAAGLHTRLAWRRGAMLGCACTLSIGSHYATYTLGPIKKSLGTSEGGFAALISAFELLNTVTPLVSGFLVPRFGAAACGLVATGSVLLGQIIVCLAQSSEGGVSGNLGGMVFGLLVFGAGISPLAVVQETIILKHNSSSSHFTARAVALGLVLGKTASFAAGWSSDRLHSISPRLPFIVAAALALFSFSACVLYAAIERSTSRLLVSSTANNSGDAPSGKHYEHESKHPPRPLRLSALASFGDPFWLYIAVCALAGMWYATNHLASHFLQSVYLIPQKEASGRASLLLATSTFLYPIIGWALDKRPSLLSKLWLAVPILTAATYSILLFLSAAIPPTVALLPAALGMGSGPLLLVLVVPRLVERHQAATALGAHKSLEMAGAIIYQSICGFLLSLGQDDTPEGGDEEQNDDADYALFFLLLMALVMVGLVARWWVVIRRKEERAALLAGGEAEAGFPAPGRRDDAEYGLLEPGALTDSEADEESPSREERRGVPLRDLDEGHEDGGGEGEMGRKEREELERGRKAMRAAAGVVVLSWVCFVVNLVRE
ncbi:hypothetical protein JCM6882_004102 [Rhodosporidiobolus microsporus]